MVFFAYNMLYNIGLHNTRMNSLLYQQHLQSNITNLKLITVITNRCILLLTECDFLTAS